MPKRTNSGLKCRDSQGKCLIRLKTCRVTKVGLGKFESLDLGARCYSAVVLFFLGFFLPETLFGFLMALGTLFNRLRYSRCELG